VFVMVALPVGLLVGGLAFSTSGTVTAAERIPVSLGKAQAMLRGPNARVVWQTADPDVGYGTADGEQPPPEATPVPGFDPGAGGTPGNAAALERLTGGVVVPVGSETVRRVLDDRRSRIITVENLDLASVDLGTKAVLRSGRWAKANTEVVATSFGVSRGMPTSGTVLLRSGGKDFRVTVVGVADYFTSWGGQPDAVTAAPFNAASVMDWSYLVLRDRAIPYSEVKRLNGYGFQVMSADVLRHPPTAAELPPQIQQVSNSSADDVRVAVAMGGVMLLLVTTLLVSPAFAVAASRQRRTLALAASNGAETRQLRRTVLAQALVLGVLSALVAAALALVVLRAVMWAWVAARPWTTFRFFEVPVWAVVAVVLMAVVSVLIAALIPSMRLGRLDIVGVMKGQNVSPRLNRVLPVLGALMAGGGGVGLVMTVARRTSEIPVMLMAIVLVLGALLLVPFLLVTAGRLAANLPVAPRLAARDAARHRTRAVPTVAAIMAGAIALTAFGIGLASDSEQQRRDYRPQLPAGMGQLYVNGDPANGAQSEDDLANAERLVRSVAPTLRLVRLGMVTALYDPANPTAPTPFVTAVPPSCTAEQSVSGTEAFANGQSKCGRLGTNSQYTIGVLPADEIIRLAGLTGADASRIRNGGILVRDRGLVTGGKVAMAVGTVKVDNQGGTAPSLVGVTRTDQVPAVVGRLPIGASMYGGVVSDKAAKALGWPVGQYMLLLRNPDGAISGADEKALTEVLDENTLYVERGFSRDDAVFMAIMFGAFALLLLIVTLISTALALAEQQTDLGTLAAVGATRGTRRRFAAAQAATVAFLGALVGIAVGLAPGIAITYPLTTVTWDPETGQQLQQDPITVIPWLHLGLVLVGVPVVAALIAAVAIRRAPTMTRRAG
jgi:putative ABC transport system permease protein